MLRAFVSSLACMAVLAVPAGAQEAPIFLRCSEFSEGHVIYRLADGDMRFWRGSSDGWSANLCEQGECRRLDRGQVFEFYNARPAFGTIWLFIDLRTGAYAADDEDVGSGRGACERVAEPQRGAHIR